MPGFHIEDVMLKYLINHGCGCGQRSNITLYDASRGRSDCGESTTSRQRRQHCLPEKLSNPVCWRRIVLHTFWELWSFATKNGFEQLLFLLTMHGLLKKIYLSNKVRSTIRHTFTKEKNFPDKRGAVASWAHP